MINVRNPVYAGKFYEGNKERLLRQLEECFSGLSQSSEWKKEVVAIIAPHAGYVYSGRAAAAAYAELAYTAKRDVFIVLAPNHTGHGMTSISSKAYQTPLGVVESDRDGVDFLVKTGAVSIDDLSHEYEHSLEVQLPFLQYVYTVLNKRQFSIVPIVVSSTHSAMILSEGLIKLIKRYKERRFCIIASSDFTHQGRDYGYVPFKKDVKENIEKLDKGAIEMLLKLDDEGFHRYVEETGATICGYLPILTTIHTLKAFGKIEGRLLKYYTSGDVVGDYTNSVSYAALAFYQRRG